ncbi:NAD(P)/FAD-dependent oxidoreductase [Gracilimonas mengyeensis]|uniref:Sulfide:quinone oxidoreductase n=1 Tax=Gracilimonas mengyeensis TaxID=1302730 RepID=A0A521F1Z7_9BACT|nr:FAD/NAD(P)-binding oxidoreductase [Gracilimonas mengyeensis]SMO90193.1 sulfide:quinone oxidoreductase [Gracilimonas mengyeensis]
MKKQILVLGGGLGGVQAAKELSKKIGNEEGITLANILVFEREEQNVFQPSLTWLMVGKRKEEQLYRETKNIEGGGIEVILGDIEKIDPDELTVTVKGEAYKGDYMIVSLGVQQAADEALSQAGHNFYTMEGASGFYKDLQAFEGGKIAITVPSLPFKSPVAPYEAAMLVEEYVREKGLRDKTEITIYTPEKEPMGFAGSDISDNVMKLMAERYVRYVTGYNLKDISSSEMIFEDHHGEQKKAAFDLLAYTPHHQCPKVVTDAGLVGESGWVEVNRETLETKYPKVFAIGDITRIKLNSGELLPKAGVFARHEAEVVAHNIAKEVYGKLPDKKFEGEGSYILDLGEDEAGRVSGDFYSSEVKMDNPGVIRHWEKILTEKSWFIKYF